MCIRDTRSDERFASELALVHSRFSTNTFPSWPLAHPYRLIAHNGEINTVKGNRNWMRARESQISSTVIPGDIERVFPICTPGASDSATFDEVLELLHLGGRSLPHAVLMICLLYTSDAADARYSVDLGGRSIIKKKNKKKKTNKRHGHQRIVRERLYTRTPRRKGV